LIAAFADAFRDHVGDLVQRSVVRSHLLREERIRVRFATLRRAPKGPRLRAATAHRHEPREPAQHEPDPLRIVKRAAGSLSTNRRATVVLPTPNAPFSRMTTRRSR